MSKDNWIAIVETKHKQPLYYGYDLSASVEYPTTASIRKNKPIFVAATIKDAIIIAQEKDAEYGYTFVNVKGQSVEAKQKTEGEQ